MFIVEIMFAVTRKEKRLINDKNKKMNKGFILIFPKMRKNGIESVNRYSTGAGSTKTNPFRKMIPKTSEIKNFFNGFNLSKLSFSPKMIFIFICLSFLFNHKIHKPNNYRSS